MKRKFLTLAFVIICAISLTACKKGTFEVESKKSNTYITIPSKYNPTDDLSLLLDEYGFSHSKTNKDGDVTYKISNENYKAFLESAKNSINDYIEDINNSDMYESIESISINDNYSTITVCVDKNAFKESTDDLTVNALALKVAMYQGYKGKDISVKIKYKDINTNKVYDDVTIE